MGNSKTIDLLISKIIVDEAMRIVLSTIKDKNEITICRCSMIQALNSVNASIKNAEPAGIIRFVFLSGDEPLLVLLNADYIIKRYKSIL